MFYTDRIVGCMDPSRKVFGNDGFKDFIRSNSIPTNKFTGKLLSTLQASSGKDTFNDDVCLIVYDVMIKKIKGVIFLDFSIKIDHSMA